MVAHHRSQGDEALIGMSSQELVYKSLSSAEIPNAVFENSNVKRKAKAGGTPQGFSGIRSRSRKIRPKMLDERKRWKQRGEDVIVGATQPQRLWKMTHRFY